MEYLMFFMVAVAASLGIAIVFRTPIRNLWITVLLSVLAIYLDRFFSIKFLICLTLACLAHLCARRFKSPAQGFLVPGFIFLVPGSAIYGAITALASQDTVKALEQGLVAVTMTLNISFAILMANWIMPARTEL